MNERIKQIAASSLIIKQLAKQAEEYADIEYNASDLDWYELKEEKFAELIVRECEKVAKNPKWYGESPSEGWGRPIRHVCTAMKEHFGVEE